jgi:hypothetical protein
MIDTPKWKPLYQQRLLHGLDLGTLDYGYNRKAGQKGTQFLFVSSNLSRLKRVPL